MAYRRETFIKKTSEYLGLDTNNVIVLNIEKGIFNQSIKLCKEKNTPLKWSNSIFTSIYSKIARKILANISYTPNSEVFKNRILAGDVDPYSIATFTHENMHPELWSELRINMLKKHITKQEEVGDGMFTCNACKSKKTVYYQMQTRSADEPMTTYVTCTNCNKKWKC
tara:strand:+ start:5715 stop:6218 length:504 start_codon:yes stop_codon:yes gene_type:complete